MSTSKSTTKDQDDRPANDAPADPQDVELTEELAALRQKGLPAHRRRGPVADGVQLL